MAPKTTNKQINKLLKEAERQGWRLELRKGGHIMCFSPNKEDIITLSASPHDRTSYKKVESDLKRGGLK